MVVGFDVTIDDVLEFVHANDLMHLMGVVNASHTAQPSLRTTLLYADHQDGHIFMLFACTPPHL